MLALIIQSLPAFSQYKDADSLASNSRQHIENASDRLNVDPLIVESIVYPELMRYSALRNDIESSLVNGFYVKFGSQNGDFSIGHFQMKPSFVENLEKRWNTTDSLSTKYQIYFNTSSRSEYSRNSRIARMLSIEGQSLYVVLFVKMMFYYFSELQAVPALERVRILATAYNCGIRWPSTHSLPEERSRQLQTLMSQSTAQRFHTDLVANPFTKYYSYSALAEEHYRFLLLNR